MKKLLIGASLTSALAITAYTLKPSTYDFNPTFCTYRQDGTVVVGTQRNGMTMTAIGRLVPERCEVQDTSGPPVEMSCGVFEK